MREEVIASARAQLVDTSGYEITDLEDIELFWENPLVESDAVFGPRIDSPFWPTAFKDLEIGASSENTSLLDEEEDKSSPATTPVFERPTEAPTLLRSRPFENVPAEFV